jgi:biotin operon repressor
MKQIKQYLRKVFGEKVEVTAYKKMDNLPLYLRDAYDYSLLIIHLNEYVVMKSKAEAVRLPQMVDHRRSVSEKLHQEVVLLLNHASANQKSYLFQNNVPFLVPESVTFLPGNFIRIEERNRLPVKTIELFTPSEQLLCLALLYESADWFSGSELARKLDLSTMTVSRALRSLMAESCLEMKDSPPRQKYRRIERSAYYEIVKKHFRSPVMEKVYYPTNAFDGKQFCHTGDTALADLTDLSRQDHFPWIAMAKSEANENAAKCLDAELVFNKRTDVIGVEIWSYDPKKMARNGVVDPLSLVASLGKERNNERVDAACRELEEKACYESINYANN